MVAGSLRLRERLAVGVRAGETAALAKSLAGDEDERGFAKALLERVDALDQGGPPLLPEGEDEMVRVWYLKMLGRIARGDLEAKYRRIELLFQALEDYFKLRGLWYRGPKAGLPWLAMHDPETHATFARALEPHASLEDLHALVQRVLPPE